MRPLSDPLWAIQFQSDDWDGHHPSVNIGWYWARPCNETRELFRRSQEQWENTHDWDQAVVNYIRYVMVTEGILTDTNSFVVDLSDYVRADVLTWGPIYLDPRAIDRLNSESVMVHYTGFFGLMKSYMPKHFGHWVNETYYTQPMSLLQPINISGTLDEILKQMAFAIHLARSSHRTFMWPISLNQTWDADFFETRPAVAVVDEQSVANAVSWVEGTYIHNRGRYAKLPLSEQMVPITFNDIQRDTWVNDMLIKCRSSMANVVKVDFGLVSAAEVAGSEKLAEVIQEIVLWEKTKTWLR
jgi:Nucleotide-diphospho-sugar transferase